MSITKLNCPHCGASLEPKDGLDTFFCTYCGGKIILDMSDAAYKARVDFKNIEKEVEINKQILEHEALLKEKAYEQERYNEKKRFRLLILMPFILMAPMLIMLLGFKLMELPHKKDVNELERIESNIIDDINHERYDTALNEANQLYDESGWSTAEKEEWDSKREYYITLILEKKRESDVNGEFIAMTKSSHEYEGEKYSKVMDELKGLGFLNVTAKETSEEKGFFDGNKTIEHITISGKTGFSKDETYDKNSAIVLYYYSKD